MTPFEGYLIPELTRLRIKFTSEEDETNGITSNTTSTAAFVNTERILYQIPSSEVPFERFRVQIAQLVDGLTGPFVPRLESVQVVGEHYYDCAIFVFVGINNDPSNGLIVNIHDTSNYVNVQKSMESLEAACSLYKSCIFLLQVTQEPILGTASHVHCI